MQTLSANKCLRNLRLNAKKLKLFGGNRNNTNYLKYIFFIAAIHNAIVFKLNYTF